MEGARESGIERVDSTSSGHFLAAAPAGSQPLASEAARATTRGAAVAAAAAAAAGPGHPCADSAHACAPKAAAAAAPSASAASGGHGPCLCSADGGGRHGTTMPAMPGAAARAVLPPGPAGSWLSSPAAGSAVHPPPSPPAYASQTAAQTLPPVRRRPPALGCGAVAVCAAPAAARAHTAAPRVPPLQAAAAAPGCPMPSSMPSRGETAPSAAPGCDPGPARTCSTELSGPDLKIVVNLSQFRVPARIILV
jgi:hypothetical protein